MKTCCLRGASNEYPQHTFLWRNKKKNMWILPLQGSYVSGKCQGNLNFFKVRELSGNSVMCQGKMKFCKNVREMSGNFTFQSDEAGMFVPMYLFC